MTATMWKERLDETARAMPIDPFRKDEIDGALADVQKALDAATTQFKKTGRIDQEHLDAITTLAAYANDLAICYGVTPGDVEAAESRLRARDRGENPYLGYRYQA